MFANIKINGKNNLQKNFRDKIIKAFKIKEIQVGIDEEAKYDDGTLVVVVANVHEFGSVEKNIPARPFMRAGAKKFSKSWAKSLIKYKLNTFDSGLKTLSNTMVKDMKDFIMKKQGGFVPLSQKTIERKGFDTPLYDTGKMVDSIKAVIIKNESTKNSQ